jgi:hypothetical protein
MSGKKVYVVKDILDESPISSILGVHASLKSVENRYGGEATLCSDMSSIYEIYEDPTILIVEYDLQDCPVMTEIEKTL